MIGEDPTDQVVVLGRRCLHNRLEHLDEGVAVLQVFDNDPCCAQRYRLGEWRSSTVVEQKFESMNLYRCVCREDSWAIIVAFMLVIVRIAGTRVMQKAYLGASVPTSALG